MIATVDCSGSIANPPERRRPIDSASEQPEHLLVLGLLRAGRVSPGVAPSLCRRDPELGAHARVQPFGHRLGALDAEPVDEQLLGELAVSLELGHQLGDRVAGGDRLDRDDVDLARLERPVEVGEADPVMAGLAREDEPLELALAGRLRVPDDQFVAIGVAREVAEQRARMQVVLLTPHPLQTGLEVAR